MELELDLGNPSDSKNAIRLRDNMKAYKNLVKLIRTDEKLSTDLIIKTVGLINNTSEYISKGYRKIGAKYIADSDVPITETSRIEE